MKRWITLIAALAAAGAFTTGATGSAERAPGLTYGGVHCAGIELDDGTQLTGCRRSDDKGYTTVISMDSVFVGLGPSKVVFHRYQPPSTGKQRLRGRLSFGGIVCNPAGSLGIRCVRADEKGYAITLGRAQVLVHLAAGPASSLVFQRWQPGYSGD
jgi:hypothetical protein